VDTHDPSSRFASNERARPLVHARTVAHLRSRQISNISPLFLAHQPSPASPAFFCKFICLIAITAALYHMKFQIQARHTPRKTTREQVALIEGITCYMHIATSFTACARTHSTFRWTPNKNDVGKRHTIKSERSCHYVFCSVLADVRVVSLMKIKYCACGAPTLSSKQNVSTIESKKKTLLENDTREPD